MDVRKILQEELTEEMYVDICDFIEELYMMEYDLLVLMARKFFNLFCVFHKLNCEKYERLGIEYRNNGKIITNRALPLLRNDIKNGLYKKIIIADDIIIHGRSIKGVYDDLIKICPQVEIDLVSYVSNSDGIIGDLSGIKNKIDIRYSVHADAWKGISYRFVKAFYLAARPYISYLPYYTLRTDWDTLKNNLEKENCYDIEISDMHKYKVKAFIYRGSYVQRFEKLKSSGMCAIRFYYYSKIGQIIAIPYFSIKDTMSSSVISVAKKIREKYCISDYQGFRNPSDISAEISAMEIEYILSTWIAAYVFNKCNIEVEVWHRDIEEYNFVKRLLPDNLLKLDEIEERIMFYSQIESEMNVLDVFSNKSSDSELLSVYDAMEEKYKAHYLDFINGKSLWNKEIDPNKKSYLFIQRFIGNFMYENGNVDEARCKKKVEQKRSYGISVMQIIDKMSLFLIGLTGSNDLEKIKRQVYASIISIVDSGRGTIVNYENELQGSGSFIESVIYAGEQNYMFCEETNFPLMYGLFLLEQNVKKDNLEDMKHIFIQKLMEYMHDKKIFYIEEEITHLAQLKMEVMYGQFLQESYYKYCENHVLKKAIELVEEICFRKNG